MIYDDWDDYLDELNYDKEEKNVDSLYCSCYNREVVESHICVNRIPTEEDKFKFCKNCRKEVK